MKQHRRDSFLRCLQALLPLAFCSYYTNAFCGIGVNNFCERLHPVCRLDSSSSGENESSISFVDEETLLQVHFSVKEDSEEAMNKVKQYCQRFPFAAVLPVQPLTYLPTDDGGVEVKFLRKKTKEKGSVDGGMRFFITENENGVTVLVKRNSEGQTVPKMFSEKLVVQAFVKGIAGETPDKTNPAPIDAVDLESVFHKWLNL